MTATKRKWQQRFRETFRQTHGYSDAAHYATGGLREAVLERDGRKCVACGMTEEEHVAKWGRPITVDHFDQNRANNSLQNLQTMCLACHGKKEWLFWDRKYTVRNFREQITAARQAGRSFQSIADEFGFSVASIWKWCRRWGDTRDYRNRT